MSLIKIASRKLLENSQSKAKSIICIIRAPQITRIRIKSSSTQISARTQGFRINHQKWSQKWVENHRSDRKSPFDNSKIRREREREIGIEKRIALSPTAGSCLIRSSSSTALWCEFRTHHGSLFILSSSSSLIRISKEKRPLRDGAMSFARDRGGERAWKWEGTGEIGTSRGVFIVVGV